MVGLVSDFSLVLSLSEGGDYFPLFQLFIYLLWLGLVYA